MECTVRKSTDGRGGNGGGQQDESRLMEMEKLQRLVRSLQEQNEQLMAAAVGGGIVDGGDHSNRTTATTNGFSASGGGGGGVDPPRDSGIDLSASCSDETEDDILDLERFDFPDDEESWLYSTPAAKSQDDVLAWLRKDIGNLDPAARRALAIKLELLIARKKNDSAVKNALDNSTTSMMMAQEDARRTTVPISLSLDFEEEGIMSMEEPCFDNSLNLLSPEFEPNRVITRRTTFKVDRKLSSEAAAAAAAAAASPAASSPAVSPNNNNNTATFVRPKKASKDLTTPSTNIAPKKSPQLIAAAPAFTITDDGNGLIAASGTSPGRKLTFDAIHSELNPNLHDIQLLASMQEEELRRCLINLQQMNRRRRPSSGNNQKEGDASPLTPQSSASGTSNSSMQAGVVPGKTPDRYGTYTKPKQQHQQLSTVGAPNGVVLGEHGGKPGSINGRKVASSSGQTPQNLQTPMNHEAIISAQVTGLQKSLPNLSGSKSEFNLPAPSFPVDTSSEKGSYGDIPSAMNPPTRSQATTSSTPRLVGQGSRLPTPARSRLPTPAKSGIPMPRTGPSLPVPMSKQRTKSPAVKVVASSAPKMNGSLNDSWKEGCF